MARIRTIKPEFWQSETMAGVSEHARLLAIALLNHSDDSGYFMANVALVRAACFPFDEHSRKVLGSIQELSGIGYIEVRDCGGKPIGRVLKFLEHQRIDKPQKSKLESIFMDFSRENADSRKVPGILQEDSKNSQRLEQGTGNREREQGTGNGTVISSELAIANSKQELNPEECKFPTFPTAGNPKTWEAPVAMLSDWQATYPAVDVSEHHRRAHAWVMVNLAKRKTAGGMPKFLNAWFAKQQDAAKPNGHQQKTFAQMRVENSKKACDEFVDFMKGRSNA